MSHKFINYEITEDKIILWDSPEHYIGIGTTDNPGLNYVGVNMMNIREKIKELKNQKIKARNHNSF